MEPNIHGRDQGDWIDELIAAFNTHDATEVATFMTDDAEYICWSGDAWGATRGKESIVHVLDGYDKELSSDFRLQRKFAVITEEGFAVEYHESGTHDRGSNPSGKSFSLRNVMFGELRNGKIARMTDYSDVTAFRAQTSLA
ncbi:MAG TPA: nuclear transport factor 2 family protein [Acidimicrobiales bacterium]|nr:nuclear transport factor 2 family protein [Acidimicrobiales bacterium]